PYGARVEVEGILGSKIGAVDRHLGNLAVVLGRHDDAVGHFERAIDTDARAGAALFVSRSELALGQCLLARGLAEDAARGEALVRRAEAALASMGAVVPGAGTGDSSPPSPTTVNAFRREAGSWSLSFDGTTVTVSDAKGLHDLAWLLAHPGTEVAAVELMGVGAAPVVGMGSDAVLDDAA